MNLTTWLMTLLGILAGVLAGALLHAWWLRRKSAIRLRPPAKWPLKARGLVTTDENEVWHWLRTTFAEHVVMAKVPVLRFTIPLELQADKEKNKAERERLLEMLDGVYPTFTVATLDGKVVGCVEVPGKRGFSPASQALKEALLSDCGIPFTTIRASRLPAASAIRAAFLGELAVENEQETEILGQEALKPPGGDSRFQAELNAFTQQRINAAKDAALKELNRDTGAIAASAKAASVGFNAEGTGTIRTPEEAGRFAERWEDSFIQPLDTRPAKLE